MRFWTCFEALQALLTECAPSLLAWEISSSVTSLYWLSGSGRHLGDIPPWQNLRSKHVCTKATAGHQTVPEAKRDSHNKVCWLLKWHDVTMYVIIRSSYDEWYTFFLLSKTLNVFDGSSGYRSSRASKGVVQTLEPLNACQRLRPLSTWLSKYKEKLKKKKCLNSWPLDGDLSFSFLHVVKDLTYKKLPLQKLGEEWHHNV